MDNKLDDFYTVEEYEELMTWTKNLEEGKKFLEAENKKMKDWVNEIELTKVEVLKQLDEKNIEFLEMQKKLEEADERALDYKKTIAELENEKSKLNYKINRYLSNPKIKKIVESKKLDQF